MTRYLLVISSVMLVYACKKDVALPNTNDPRVGNYFCIKITNSASLDTAGHIVTTSDTANSVFTANVSANGATNYNVSVDGYVFSSSTTLNGEYFAACPNGPCSSIKFYSTDSVKIFRKVNNAVSIYYKGRK